MKEINFTVDSALLRELGERLVGKPHIALAELIKNSYDADATKVVVTFDKGHLTVEDDGHGMTFSEFESFWMRIGSPHKEQQRRSRNLGRPLTGSKGVGRLSAQFLAFQLELRTAASPDAGLVARVNWKKAIDAGELTKAKAEFEERQLGSSFPKSSSKGTTIDMWELNQTWDAAAFEDLAKEIWNLQPPFRDLEATLEKPTFEVQLKSEDQEIVETFAKQMEASLTLYSARLVGRLERGGDVPTMILSLQFRGEARPTTVTYERPRCNLASLDFEVRIFSLQGRQAVGIKVQDLRDYLNRYGGVHVYDSGFRLPYYGVDVDWLGIEQDHSHRLSRSKLLPDEFQVEEGLNFLPTASRIFGVANVSTSAEREAAGADNRTDYLMIQVTRDRLVDNAASRELRDLVRWAIDFYATREAVRQLQQVEARAEVVQAVPRIERIEEVLDRHEAEMPAQVYRALRTEVGATLEAVRTEEEITLRQMALLAPLATAGIAALAHEHEAVKQLELLQAIGDRLEAMAGERLSQEEVADVSRQVKTWISRERGLRALFSPLLDESSRTEAVRFRARALIQQVEQQLSVLVTGITYDLVLLDPQLLLPPGTFAEWSAVFQNAIINASNAMLDSAARRIGFSSTAAGRNRAIVVQDTGRGINLKVAEEMFKPFARQSVISPERRSLGLGGTGLGLTIVRMIATNRGASVRFVPPREGYRTALELSWRE